MHPTTFSHRPLRSDRSVRPTAVPWEEADAFEQPVTGRTRAWDGATMEPTLLRRSATPATPPMRGRIAPHVTPMNVPAHAAPEVDEASARRTGSVGWLTGVWRLLWAGRR